MRPRWLFVTACISLLLFLVTAAFWIQSYRVWYAWDWDDAGTRHTVGSSLGHLFYDHVTPASARSRRVGFHSNRVSPTAPTAIRPPTRSFAGFRMTQLQAAGNTWFDLRIPYWLPALLTAIAPAITIRRLALGQSAPGRCPTCGYDLRATPGRCPECGTRPIESRLV